MKDARIKRLIRIKNAQQSTDGILSTHPVDLDERDMHRNVDRSAPHSNGLYGISFKNEKFEAPEGYKESSSLSTRYVPNMPGVQAQRVPGTSNVFKDPNSGKIFDYNEGFVEDNVVYNPQGVHYQTSTMYSSASDVSSFLRKSGLSKQARIIDILFEK